MKLHWPNGDVVVIGKDRQEITREQWDSLEKLQERHDLPDPMEVLPGLGYIGVMAGTLFIGIEPDGHAHT
jgi:hypothetical protein